MKVEQKVWADGAWKGRTNLKNKANLVLAFGHRETIEDPARFADLKAAYPNAHIVMGSTSGEIHGAQVNDNTIVANALQIDGRNVTRLPMYRRARLGIGYLPQEASIFRGLTVEQNIMAVLELSEPKRKRRQEKLDELLEEFKITRLRKSPSMALSGGERRRCEIARALASDPSFMLLDEPFAGIDPLAVGDIQDLVRHLTRRGIGVLITDHNVRETLELVDRAYVIADGRVLTHGNPQEIISNEDVRRVYLGDMFG